MHAADELAVGTAPVALSRAEHRPQSSGLIGRVRARPAAFVALAVLVVSWGVLVAVHHTASPVIPRARALTIVERSPLTKRLLSGLHWNRVTVQPIDSSHDSVWFYRGPRLLVSAIVDAGGSVEYDSDAARQHVAYGSNIANNPLVLGLLTVVFALMSAVWPLWRVRNLDVLALAASTTSIVLLNGGLLGRTVVFGALVLLYLGLRCAWMAFAPQRASPPAISLFDQITFRWQPRQRVRVLRLLMVACALVLAMVGISSTGVVDVGWAVMEGATDILHGMLPYGHVPGVLHGDTYPIGSYLLYLPAAWLSPVDDTWDSADVTLFVAVAATLAGAAALWRSRRRRSPAGQSGSTDVTALRMTIAWLTFPALVVTVTTGSTDAVLAAIVLGVILAWRRPAAASALVAAGAWFKLVPLALLPLVLAPLRGRRLAAALAAAAAISVAALAPLLALGGLGAITAMAHAVSYQVARVSPQSLWAVTGSVPLQQLVQAATLALVVGAAVRLRRDGALASDRRRLAALCAAVMIGLQLSASYWTYMYLAWALPGLMLSLLWGTGERDRQ